MEFLGMKRDYYVVIERDEDGFFIGEVPQLPACYSQGKTLDELLSNIKEVIELCLEEITDDSLSEFIGVQKVTI
jgi:predicted RNase H-like HicB family nuclease